MTIKDRILELVTNNPGLTDREITNHIYGPEAPQQSVNQAARNLVVRGLLIRKNRNDGKIGNYISLKTDDIVATSLVKSINVDTNILSEDDTKKHIKSWLTSHGWKVNVIYGRGRGIDIEATLGGSRWVIEVKGCGSRNAMRVNYFLAILGELLQRMDDSNSRYSIALPNMKQYRRLWERLPKLAKDRTKITALFVSGTGRIEEIL